MKFIAVDIETDGLDSVDNNIKMISWCDGRGTYTIEDIDYIIELLKDKQIQKFFHYQMFDVPMLRNKGIIVRNIADTYLMAKVLSIDKDISLNNLSNKLLGINLDKTLQHGDNWNGEITTKHVEYAKADAEATYKLAELLQARLDKNHQLKDEYILNQRTLDVLCKVKQNGFKFDSKRWNEDLTKMRKELLVLKEELITELEKRLKDEDGVENIRSNANFNSYVDVLTIYGYVIPNLKSTKDSELAKYDYIRAVRLLREYRKLYKIVNCNNGYEKFLSSDGRVHSNWTPCGAETGRFSCSSPNIQQVPRTMRKYFCAEEGYKIMSLDYSQVELRVAAALSRDKQMIKAFVDKRDLHSETAKIVFSKDKVTSLERSVAKTINFGLVYGMTAYGLRERLQHTSNMKVNLEKCERFIEKFFNHYRGLRRWLDIQNERGTISTVGGKTWRTSKLSPMMRANYPIQGTGAEIMKHALILLDKRLPSRVNIIAVVHDEVVLEVPDTIIGPTTKVAEECMIEGFKEMVDIDVSVDVNVGQSWNK
ncbi:DNA polymerase [Mycoplasmatota bacterium WC44]